MRVQLMIVSALEHKLLLAGFTETQVLLSESTISSEAIPSVIKAKKPSWKIGSSFALKKVIVRLEVREKLAKIALVEGQKRRKKVLKLGLTAEQINNPRSACGKLWVRRCFQM